MSKNSTYIMSTYGDRNLEFKEGQGCYLTSIENNKYLDFYVQIALYHNEYRLGLLLLMLDQMVAIGIRETTENLF